MISSFMKKLFLILLILGLVSTNLVQAQPGSGTPPPPPGDDEGGPANAGDVPLPINTLVLLGLSVGAVAGVKSLSKSKK